MLAVALMDLAEHDQWHGQVIEEAEAPVEVDGRLRRLDALRLAPIGECAVSHREVRVQPRLEAEIADLLRRLEPAQARLDAAARIERAVQYAEVGVAAARSGQQAVRLGERDAALDLLHGLGRPAGA